MSITVNIYYTGKGGAARRFAEGMMSGGTVTAIRNEEGNLRYEYFYPADDPETVLLIDSWVNQAAIDRHHNSPMMQTILALREKYDLTLHAERFVSADIPAEDAHFIEK